MKKSLLIVTVLSSFGLGYAANHFVAQAAAEKERRKVTGIGGIFFKCKDPKALKVWYKTHLGMKTDGYGTMFEWREGTDSSKKAYTQWSPFSATTKYFDPSVKDFMINYRVEDLSALATDLKNEGVTILDTIAVYDYGKFLHIMDLEGNKIELWEPIDATFDKTKDGKTK